MMIGIITQPLHFNYGGLLQNFALQKVLEGMGHTPVTLDVYSNNKHLLIRFAIFCNTFFHFLIGKKGNRVFFPFIPDQKARDFASRETLKFIRNHITAVHLTHRKLFSYCNHQSFEGYIVGSDQVWRPMYNPFILDSFLHFARKEKFIKRIAYAASFGVDENEYGTNLRNKCRELISLFDIVTVRETTGIKLCKDILGVDAQQVLDPTLLLNASDYIKRLELRDNKEKKNLFYYLLNSDNNKVKFIDSLSEQYHKEKFTVSAKKQFSRLTRTPLTDDYIYPKVEQWLEAILNAEMIITDSFHCMVFAIIFNKTFWVLSNGQRGNTRFLSLLDVLGLENRYIDSVNHTEIVDKKINWEDVNCRIEKMRNNSMKVFDILNN